MSDITKYLRRWFDADAEVERLRKERDSNTCEIEYHGSNAPDDQSEEACWRSRPAGSSDGVMEGACDPCIRRQSVQILLTKAKANLRRQTANLRKQCGKEFGA